MSEIETTIEVVETSEDSGRFVIEPLEQGFGTTLGSAMRRLLLGGLPGTAITTVKIEGVYHEFTSIPHVKEDVTEFFLNVKQIRLRSFSDRPVKLSLEVSGEGEVCAGDIVTPPDVEIVNPELHLAYLDSPDARLTVEFDVERGRGYVPAGHQGELPIGTMPVDAIFTPMRKVNYVVEPTRVRERTDLERLLLEVTTDSTITPRQAVSQAARILTENMRLLLDLERQPARIEKRGLSAVPISARDYERSIEELELSVRAYNCLKRSGITKIGTILAMSDDELLGVRNFGQKSLDELKAKLADRGFVLHSLADEEPAPLPRREDEEDLALPTMTTYHFDPDEETKEVESFMPAPPDGEEDKNET